jgi:Ca2+-binding RTX toxin-like protein
MAVFDGIANVPAVAGTEADDFFRVLAPSGTVWLYGLTGNDVYELFANNAIIVEEFAQGTDTVRVGFDGYVLGSNLENLTLLSGDAGQDARSGTGNALANTLIGNEQDNTLDGAGGIDRMEGGLGDDEYIVDSTLDVVIELTGAGLDKVISSATFLLGLNVEDLTLVSGANINGTGNALANVLEGNSGNNVLSGLGGNDELYGDDGNDTLDGGLDNDNLFGGDGNDSLVGGAGNDRLTGGDGIDTLNGGAGNDYYVVDGQDRPVVEAAAGGDDTVESPVSWTLELNVENLILAAGAGAINGTGNAGNNHLLGNESSNTLTGLAGNDTLDGAAGADRMDGGLGNDTYLVDHAGDVVIEALNQGTDRIISSIQLSRLPDHVENLTLALPVGLGPGTTGVGYGNDLANTIVGSQYADFLLGFAGNDVLDGREGADSLQGGLGNDTFLFDHPGDFAVEFAGEGTDLVLSAVSIFRLPNNVENATLTGLENLSLFGNSAANVLTGNAGNNFIDGLGGADIMAGGLGDDEYLVNVFVAALPAASDIVTEALNAGTDKVYAYVTYVLPANVENLQLGNTAGNINGTGNALNNVLLGNPGANLLDGQAGNDVLVGSGGDDTLLGGAGNDSLDGGIGNDVMQGGVGDDTYTVDAPGDSVLELAAAGTDTVSSLITFNLDAAITAQVNVKNVENLLLLGGGDINGTGNALNNTITGNDGANSLDGGAGNDTLRGQGGADTLTGGLGDDTLDGGAGADVMAGGPGNDTYVVDNVGDAPSEAAGQGTLDTVRSTIDWTLLNDFENLTLLGTDDVNGTGNGANNVILGNDGDNEINGLGGSDTMRGGKGDDFYVVNVATDVVTENLNEGYDQVRVEYAAAAAAYVLGPNIESVIFADATAVGGGSVAFNATGNALDNVMEGNSAANTFDGGAGNDVLFGGLGIDRLSGGIGDDLLDGEGGADIMTGGAGNDWFLVDNDGDVVTEAAAGGTDQVVSTVSFNLLVKAPQVEILALYDNYDDDGNFVGPANDINGIGNTLANTIYGTRGNNVIEGGAGDDTVVLRSYAVDLSPWARALDEGEGTSLQITGVTLTGADAVYGGTQAADAGGADRLFADLVNLTGAPTISGVEQITLFSGRIAPGANTLDATNVSGARIITVSDALTEGHLPADLNLTNLDAGVRIIAENFTQGLGVSQEANTLADVQAFTLRGFDGSIVTAGIEKLEFTVVEPQDFSLTAVDLSGVTGNGVVAQFSAQSGVLDLDLPVDGSGIAQMDLSFTAFNMGVNIVTATLSELNIQVNNSVMGLTTAASLDALTIDTSAAGGQTPVGPSLVDARNLVLADGAAIEVTGTSSLYLNVIDTDVDASAMQAGIQLGAWESTASVSLTGGLDNDYINGGAGNDRINGRQGVANQLNGGDGNDTFVFDVSPFEDPTPSAGDERTNIAYLTDFESGADRIELDRTVFAALDLGALGEADFFKGDFGAHGAQQVVFDVDSGNLYYDAGGSGAGAEAQIVANLWHGGNVDHTDIFVVA